MKPRSIYRGISKTNQTLRIKKCAKVKSDEINPTYEHEDTVSYKSHAVFDKICEKGYGY